MEAQENDSHHWLVIDTETTGLDPSRHSILSFGMVLVDSTFNIVSSPSAIHARCLPVGEIDPEALRINGINLADYSVDDTREQVANLFLSWLDSKGMVGQTFGVIGHNVPFDLGFLRQIPLDWTTVFNRKVLDTKVIASYLKAVGAPIEKQSLSALVELLVTDPEIRELRAHGALNDCYRTLAVLKAMIKLIKRT